MASLHRVSSLLLALLGSVGPMGTLGGCVDDSQNSSSTSESSGDVRDSETSQRDASSHSGNTDTPPISPLQTTPEAEGVSPDGHPDVREGLEDEARAGRIQGPGETGFDGIWSHCRLGDFKLYNDEIAVCIQETTTNRHVVFTGGKLVDAHPVGYEGEDTLSELMPLVRLGTVRADSVRVVRDGSSGGAAVIRVRGEAIPVAQVFGVIGRGLGAGSDVDITVEYRLRPGSREVEIVSWLSGYSGQRPPETGDWFAAGDRARVWRPGEGFETADTSFAWLGAVAKTNREMSYGWVTAGEPATSVSLLAERVPWVAARTQSAVTRDDGTAAYRRWFVVGDGTLESIRRAAHRLRDESIEGRERTVRITDEAGSPAVGRGVTVRRDGEPITFGRTDEDGRVTWTLSEGEWTLDISPPPGGETRARSVSFGSDQTSAEVSVPTTGRLDWTIREAETDEPVTARVVARNDARTEEWFPRHGELDVSLAAGEYRVLVMRGPEYEAETFDVTIEPGETNERTIDLERILETEGWLSGDFHQHMEPSIDSSVHVRDRVLENVAVGVEFVVPTDHDVVTDLRSTIRALDLEDRVATASGVEISPLEAHLNLYPMPHQHEASGGGTVELATLEDGEPDKRTVPELVEQARSLEHDPFVQLNHARRDSSGLLELVDFDPERPPESVEHEHYTLDFDTLEIINGFDQFCQLVADWSGLLNAGYTPTGLGNSDTHGLGGQSGVPRNYLRTDASPAEADADTIREPLETMAVTVGSHAFIELGSGYTSGDVISPETDDLSMPVRVQTPGWSRAERLAAIVNGTIVQTWNRDESAVSSPFDFQRTVELSIREDSWVVFIAWGPPPSSRVDADNPTIAFTNPIFVDRNGDADGDGHRWEAPGSRALNLEVLATTGLCQ